MKQSQPHPGASKACSLAGFALRDLPRWVRALAGNGGLLALRNRGESLEAAPDASGYRCLWQWTSALHVPSSRLARHVVRSALRQHPARFAASPSAGTAAPEISFVIGHRGTERVPQLLATLRSIAAQSNARIECIVVDQDAGSALAAQLPAWVRRVHAPPPVADMPYARSWGLNVGVRHARAAVLVLHDNDMLVPHDYASWILDRVRRGYEVVNAKRFVFYLREAHSLRVIGDVAAAADEAPDAIVQNLEAGGSIAITRDAFLAIGGMDESFVGWGGEDNEFWERAQRLRVWPWGGLPLVHLWHAPQPGKQSRESDALARWRELSARHVDQRIRDLQSVAWGQPAGPAGWRRI